MKKMPRLYIKDDIKLDHILYLSKDHIHYIKNVLRLTINDILEIFNNTGYVFFSKIIFITKKIIKIKTFKCELKNVESPLHIHLGQVISANEKMDFTIQKSIEMGVNVVTPLFLEKNNINKKNINTSNRIKRWKKIVIAACQQCNRNILPTIEDPKNIFSWCKNNANNGTKILFHPNSTLTINDLPKSTKYITIIIGSEKGFLYNEILTISEYGFLSIKLGPRVLRTETASIAAITALQMKFGDLAF